jgi:transketolase
VTLLEGSDAVIFAYGPVMLSEACRAAGLLLSEHGIRLRVVNLPWLNHIDVQWLSETVAGVSHVFTLDNHYITGGQGQMIAAALAGYDPGHDLRIRHFGVRDIPFCGRNDEVLRAHRLDAVSLSADIFNSMAVQHMDTAMAHT